MKYYFDFEKFQQHNGKLCPCIMPNRQTAIQDNICPCKEFIEEGKCRCMLFVKEK